MTNTKIAVFALVILGSIMLYLISYELLNYGATTSPDFVQNMFFSEMLAKKKTLRYCNEYNQKFNVSIFGSRGLKITTDPVCLTHGSMHGFIAILAGARIISDKLVFAVVPSFSIICIIYFYKLCDIFFGPKKAMLGSFLLLFSSSYLYHSVILFNNIPALCFLIMALYYLFLSVKRGRNTLIACAISSGAMAWIRYEYVLFIIPIATLLITKKERFANKLKKILIPTLVLLIFFVGLLKINTDLYGGLFEFIGSEKTSLGNSIYYNNQIVNNNINSQELFKNNISIFSKNFIRFILRYDPLLFVFLILSVFKIMEDKENKKYFLTILVISLTPIFYYLRKVWAGYFESQYIIANSYTRYLLPTYTGMILLSLKMISTMTRQHVNIFLSVYLIFNLTTAIGSPGAIKDFRLSQKDFLDKQNGFLKSIPETNAVVFTTYSDKYIFPKRTTAIYSTFSEEESISKTTEIVTKLVENNIPVYFINENWALNYIRFPIENYLDRFKSVNLITKEINQSVYKIEQLTSY